MLAVVGAFHAAGGNKTEAARSLGLTRASFRRRFDAAIHLSLIDGPPDTPTPPNGMLPTTSSIYTRTEDGARWDRYKAEDLERERAMEETLSAFMEPLKSLAKPSKPPKTIDADTLTELILADLHVGMYAYDLEAGD